MAYFIFSTFNKSLSQSLLYELKVWVWKHKQEGTSQMQTLLITATADVACDPGLIWCLGAFFFFFFYLIPKKIQPKTASKQTVWL